MAPDSQPVPPEAVTAWRTAAELAVCTAISGWNRAYPATPAELYLARAASDAAATAAAPYVRASAELAAGKAVMQREERIAELERHVAVLEVRHAEADELVRAGERERIRQLAETHQAVYTPACLPGECGPMCGQTASFADLLGDGND